MGRSPALIEKNRFRIGLQVKNHPNAPSGRAAIIEAFPGGVKRTRPMLNTHRITDKMSRQAGHGAGGDDLTLNELKIRCGHGRIPEGWAAAVCIRPVAIYLTWLLIRLRCTANAATALNALACLAGAVMIAIPSDAVILGGAACYLLGVLLDSSDGDLARFHRQPSAKGIYLDNLGHIITLPMFWLGVAMFLFHRFDRWEIILVGAIAVMLGRNAPWLALCETFTGLIEKRQVDLLNEATPDDAESIPGKPLPHEAPLKERLLDFIREPFLNLLFLAGIAIDVLSRTNGRVTLVLFCILLVLILPLNALRLRRNLRGDWIVRYCRSRLQQGGRMPRDEHER